MLAIHEDRRVGIASTNNYWEIGNIVLRGALPFVSAVGYSITLTALFFRTVQGDEHELYGVSIKHIQRCCMVVLVPAAISISVTGYQSLRQLCLGKYAEAKKILIESVKPGGFIFNVAWPSEEMEALGKAAMQMEMDMAIAQNR